MWKDSRHIEGFRLTAQSLHATAELLRTIHLHPSPVGAPPPPSGAELEAAAAVLERLARWMAP